MNLSLIFILIIVLKYLKAHSVAQNYSYGVKDNLNHCPAEHGYTLPLQNSVDPDQLASEQAN